MKRLEIKVGILEKNASMKVEINMNELVRQVYNLFQKNTKQYGNILKDKTMKTPSMTESTMEIVGKRKKNWVISHLGIAGTINSSMISGISLREHHNSGDMASFNKKAVSGMVNSAILVAGTVGGPSGMIVASALSTVYGYVGTYISNSIQNPYDTERLNYRLSNYDLRKSATFVYDTENGKSIARELGRHQTFNMSNKLSD